MGAMTYVSTPALVGAGVGLIFAIYANLMIDKQMDWMQRFYWGRYHEAGLRWANRSLFMLGPLWGYILGYSFAVKASNQ
jgi:hypothetical protein